MLPVRRAATAAAVILSLAGCFLAPAGDGQQGAPTAAATPIDNRPSVDAATTPAAPAGTESTDPGAVAGQFDVEDVGEASGLVHSRREANLAWVLDDGPGTTRVMAVRLRTGQRPAPSGAAGAVEVAGLVGTDTEALAAGDCAPDDDRPCLFIGDIGDNLRNRPGVQVHRMIEPDLSHGLPPEPVAADVATLTYPDGPTDAEAMFAVDGRLFIVSKAVFDEQTRETGSTKLYEAATFDDQQLVSRGVVPIPRPSLGLAADLVGNVVTGADAVGDLVVLRTYDHALLFTRPAPSDDVAAGPAIASFATWPFEEIASRGTLQTEAIAFDLSHAAAAPANSSPVCATLTVGEATGVVWRTPLPTC